MQRSYARTDMASEALGGRSGSIDGIKWNESEARGLKLESFCIESDEAAQLVGKPVGSYKTLYLEDYIARRSVSFEDTASAVSAVLKSFPQINSGSRFLVACLGNRAVTPDALGPFVSDSVLVTRHLKSSYNAEFSRFSEVSVIRTGVLGTTGIESADALRAVCGLLKPDCVIAVDALATAEISRICRNIQVCDTGISPGSGVGNDRARLDAGAVGAPVIALGVPTVIDLNSVCELENGEAMFVTPRNIDELVKSTAKLIAYGLNLALHDGLTVADIDLLIE